MIPLLRLALITALLSLAAGCQLLPHDFQPHRLQRFNQGEGGMKTEDYFSSVLPGGPDDRVTLTRG